MHVYQLCYLEGIVFDTPFNLQPSLIDQFDNLSWQWPALTTGKMRYKYVAITSEVIKNTCLSSSLRAAHCCLHR